MTSGYAELLAGFAFLVAISIVSLAYIRRKIIEKQGCPSECGSEIKEAVAERKPVEGKAGTSTITPEEGCFGLDVFISFRGKDTRNGFTSHLYKELAETRGITTFIDSVDLETGEKISNLLKDIEKSKIFVPVFSQNYAESKWCLREIAKMVEIHKKEGGKRPIIPIFYHVEPSDIKHCRKPFGKAFQKYYQEKLSEELIDEWKAALTEAGSISGFCLGDKENEAKTVTLIGEHVSKILCKLLVPFPKHTIGIGPRMDDVKQLLKREKDGDCIIGICGLGGIGKTTLAMKLYNELSLTFKDRCFLQDIRESANRQDLPSKQAQLMREVLRQSEDTGSVEGGVGLVSQRFRSKRLLLILDDVDDIGQLEAFTANRRTKEKWFGDGSKIIVTTRDKEVLLQHGLEEGDIYFPEGLNRDDSLKLFSHHAFFRDQPPEEFKELSQEVAKVAEGLPLALEVFAPLFRTVKGKQEWEEMLKILKRDQHKKVHERLKISYDSLQPREKNVFLDIACFFIGKGKKYPVYMWEACGYFPTVTLKVLQHKSLIRIGEHAFEMHDQIRDMGRMIVQQEGGDDPLKYSRPWNKDQKLKVLRDAKISMGNPYVHGIRLYELLSENIEMSWKSIAAMSSLRIFTGARLNVSFKDQEDEIIHLPSNIRWLEWNCCRYQMLAFYNDQHEKLCVLDLSYGDFRDFRSHSMEFPNLKVLDLTYCEYLIRTPDFTHLPSLEVLVLDNCWSLAEIDESIGHLEKLVKLSMEGCKKLKGLPAGLCKLTSLESLDLTKCWKISVLPTQIGDLRSLKYLGLGETSISALPDSIGTLQSLETLDLEGCKGISVLPKQIEDLTSLKCLELGMTNISALPDSIGRLRSLEELNLGGCTRISILPKQIGGLTSLKHLYLEETSISDVPDSIGSLQSLETLDLGECEGVSVLPDSVGSLGSLEDLDLARCSSLESLPDSIGVLKSLKSLSLYGCEKLEQLPNSMGMLTSLKELDIRKCKSLREVPDSLRDLNNDLQISLEGCMSLEKLPNSIRVSDVYRLRFDGFKSLRRLPDSLGDGISSTVRKLSFRGCESLEKIPESIGMRLERLEELDLSGCTLLTRIPESIGKLKSLKRLILKHCQSLEELPAECSSMLSLEELDLSGCTLLRRIPESIAKLKSLKRLILKDCQSLEELPADCIKICLWRNWSHFNN